MESLHFYGGKSTGPSNFDFVYISRLKCLNLVLIPGARLDDHRGTWTVCSQCPPPTV